MKTFPLWLAAALSGLVSISQAQVESLPSVPEAPTVVVPMGEAIPALSAEPQSALPSLDLTEGLPGLSAAPLPGSGEKGDRAIPPRVPLMTGVDRVFFPGSTHNLATKKPAIAALLKNAAKGAHNGYIAIGDEGSDVVSIVHVEGVGNLPKTGVAAVLKVVLAGRVTKVETPKRGPKLAKIDLIAPAQREPEREARLLNRLKMSLGEVGALGQAIEHELIPTELITYAHVEKDVAEVAGAVASTVDMPADQKRALLAEPSLAKRMSKLVAYLRGLLPNGGGSDELEREAKIDASPMPASVKAVALAMSKKEDDTSKAYVDFMLSLPWTERTQDKFDLNEAEKILNDSHFGLEKVKNRVLEFLAVRKRSGGLRGPILCFVGPPGVGKTSIAKAVADALGRKFVSVKLGGLADESEIRGHRRTYKDALPGSILTQMQRAGTVNPVFLLDEIDKMKEGQHGSPSAALLEVLDPEQNRGFMDHYLDLPYDLSQVLFITTANRIEDIPRELKDRMEIVEFQGYTTNEKLDIAERHIVPAKLKENGFTPEEVRISRDALRFMVEGYTAESGVRKLTQEIQALLGKLALWLDKEPAKKSFDVDPAMVEKALGRRQKMEDIVANNGVGIATALAYTDVGGVVFNVEVTATDGRGAINMREQMERMTRDSAKNAVALIRSLAPQLAINPRDFLKKDLDITFTPDDVIDGPSAGVTMATAIASRLTGRKVKEGVAMPGEVTVTGRVLPIGGLREKVLAAARVGMKMVLFPEANAPDLADIPAEVKDQIELVPVSTFDQVLERALEPKQP